MKFDPALYLVADVSYAGESNFVEKIRAAASGGVTLVQLRAKNLGKPRVAELARDLLEVLKPFGVALIINDHVDVAGEIGAAGVHVGQSDTGAKVARRKLGPDAIVGLSIESLSELETSPLDVVDYIAASPVFSTSTKTDTAPPFLAAGVAEIKRRCPLPLVGIGGIGFDQIRAVIRAGADGIAVVSAILGAADVERASRELKQEILNARRFRD